MGLGNAIGIGIPMVNLGLGGGSEPVEERFVISVKTDNAGSSADNQFSLPWIGTYDVDWGDGNTDTGVVDTQIHTYASAGTYDVAVTATTGRVYFNNGGDKTKLLDVKNWGTCEWISMQSAFYGCNNLSNISATDVINLTNCTSLRQMFRSSSVSQIYTSNWDVSNITSLYQTFTFCSNIQSLDVSSWDVSNVILMESLFRGMTSLTTLDVSSWDVSNLSGLGASRFIFQDSPNINPDISNWVLGNNNLDKMLEDADSFDRSLANWDISNTPNLLNFMQNASGMSTANYDATLISWASQNPTSTNANFGGSQYSYEAAAARQTLIDTYGWTITDGGQAVAPEFALKWETTTPNEEIQIGVGSGTFDYTIDWGDGTVESYNTDANISHTYATAGDHITKITGDFPHFSNASLNWPFNNKLQEILNWGTISWESLNGAFRGARALTVSATDIPIFGSNTIDLSTMFYDARGLTNIPNIDQWDWSKVTAMSSMFVGGGYQEIATLVGQFNITSNLTNAANFMTGTNTFTSFAGWDVTGAAAGSWNGLFRLISATSNMSTEDYDATLISWAAQSVNNNVQCSFGISQYTLGGAAEAARNTLINTYGWTITDGGGIFVGLLDTYTGAAAAYSLRNLASASVGSAVVRVRRSSDNAEQDFTATEITDGTLTTFTGANDGFVTVWYDQSGNGNNAVQSTATKQPKLVTSGVLNLENGNPALIFDGSNSGLSASQINLTESSLILSVYTYYSTGFQFVFGQGKGFTSGTDIAQQLTLTTRASSARVESKRLSTDNILAHINTTANIQNLLITSDVKNDFLNHMVNGVEIIPLATPNFDYQTFTTPLAIGRSYARNSFTLDGSIQECILFNTNQSANLAGIDSNINSHYNIY